MSPTSRRRKPKNKGPARRPVPRPAVTEAERDLLPIRHGLTHPVALHHPTRSWPRIAGVLVIAAMAYFLVPPTVNSMVLGIGYALRRPPDFETYTDSAGAGEYPEGLLASNLGVATMIVVCVLLVRWFAQAPPGIVFSVVQRIRWGYLAVCAGVALIVFVAVQAVILLSQEQTLTPQAGFWWFMLVVVLTSPLQAAAEEVLFRGFVQQAVGALAGRWWAGVIVASLLFALAHGAQSPALFVDRLGFGLVMGLLVWWTGGLEAAIGAHIINNILAFALAGLTSTIAEVRMVSEIGWDKALLDVATFAVIGLLCGLLARRWKLRRHTGPVDLSTR